MKSKTERDADLYGSGGWYGAHIDDPFAIAALRECAERNLRPPLPADAPDYQLQDQAEGVVRQLEQDLKDARKALRQARSDRHQRIAFAAETRAALLKATTLGPWTAARPFRPRAARKILQQTPQLSAALKSAGIKE